MERMCASASSSSQLKLNSNLSLNDKSKCQSVESAANYGKQYNNRYVSKRRNANRDRKQYFAPQKESRVRVVRGGAQTDSNVASNDTNDVVADYWFSSEVSDDVAITRKKGSKKQNINHLLNFSYAKREQTTQYRSGNKWPQRQLKYNKEHFLQANCQFVVSDANDYSIHALDADVCVDWHAVEEIRFNCLTKETICPICLHTPNSAKITRCGHIYCWSCILHYLSLSDQKWRKCPICFDTIRMDDLRSVSSVSKRDYKVGDEISLCLMKRQKGRTFANPVEYEVKDNNCDFESINGDPMVCLFKKILIASPFQVLNCIISREREQLMRQMSEEGDTPEACFIESALQLLSEREAQLKKKCANCENGNTCQQSLQNSCQEAQAMASQMNEYYYFYQSSDGQHIYLHNLNVRMLRHEFGETELWPINIKAKIVEMEWFSMNEEMRKRYRYMQHLPLTCEFRVAELFFDTQLMSASTLDAFRGEVLHRLKARQKREREERRRERHIQVEENKRIYGIYPLPKYQLNNYSQFPECNAEQILSASPTPSTESSITNEEVTRNLGEIGDSFSMGPEIVGASVESEMVSFAAMLREGKAKECHKNDELLLNKTEINVKHTDSDDEYQPPVHHYSLSDAFAAALQLKSTNDCTSKGDRKGKKKKRK